MSGIDPAAIRDAVKARIDNHYGSHGISVAVFSHDSVSHTFPRVVILPGSPFIEYTASFGQVFSNINLTVEVKAAAMDAVDAQRQLERLLAAGGTNYWSVTDAIESLVNEPTPTLAGAVENVMVMTADMDNGTVEADNTFVYTATLSVVIRARRN